jgi:hypothetical protein
MGTLQRLDAIPPFTRNLDARDELKWSAEFDPPAIHSDIRLRINNIGRAKVTGYAAYEGYLAVMTVPYNPPDWWVKQNGEPTPDTAALAFGAEIALLEESSDEAWFNRSMDYLRRFARRNGPDWRDDLDHAWYSGHYRRFGAESSEAAALQQLRNHPSYGPGSNFITGFKP